MFLFSPRYYYMLWLWHARRDTSATQNTTRARRLSGASTNYYLWRRTLLYLHDNMITWNINYIPSVSVIVTQFTSLYHILWWWSSLVEKLIRVLLSWVNYMATNPEQLNYDRLLYYIEPSCNFFILLWFWEHTIKRGENVCRSKIISF